MRVEDLFALTGGAYCQTLETSEILHILENCTLLFVLHEGFKVYESLLALNGLLGDVRLKILG